jgi:hypothetical protein
MGPRTVVQDTHATPGDRTYGEPLDASAPPPGAFPTDPRSNVRKGRRHMATSIDIETQAEHQYVVRLRDDDEATESWFTITPSILERLRKDGEAEEHFVRRTAEFLVQHQGVADFPDIVDLEDVIATYDDYVEYLDR